MRFLLVRVKVSNEPVCLMPHRSTIDSHELFDIIDQFGDPFQCETKTVTILDFMCVGWPKMLEQLKDGSYDICGASFSENFHSEITKAFAVSHGWKAVEHK